MHAYMQVLNVFRSVQRTLALRAAEHLPPPIPGRRLDPESTPSGLPLTARAALGRARVHVSLEAAPDSAQLSATIIGRPSWPISLASSSRVLL